MLTIVLTATLASIGTAGVPGAGMIMLTMVLQSVGLPIEGIALVAVTHSGLHRKALFLFSLEQLQILHLLSVFATHTHPNVYKAMAKKPSSSVWSTLVTK